MKKVLVLGSTGSIGKQTLDIIRHYPNEFKVVGMCANKNYKLLNEQIAEFNPPYCGIGDETLKNQIISDCETVFAGKDGLITLCKTCGADLVVCAIVGLAGLETTLVCIEEGMTIALANKETLVGGGKIVKDALEQNNVDLYPVDSEHSAIFQCLQNQDNIAGLKKIYLTASGGPFFDTAKNQMESITIKQALNHPNWSMGAKITIDSATMMNKGLEVIEAKWLFDVEPEQIQVCVHRKSIIHSMVEFMDNSILAQLGNPDMRIPIQYAMMYPKRLDCPTQPLDIFAMGALEFKRPDFDKFPCLGIAFRALNDGNCRSLVLNAANEVAVEAFLQGKIKFTDIYRIIESAYVKMDSADENSLTEILALDDATRKYAQGLI